MKKYLDVKGSGVKTRNGKIGGVIDNCVFNPAKMKIYSYIIKIQSILVSSYLIPIKQIREYGDFIEVEDMIYKISKKSIKRNSFFLIESVMGFDVFDTSGEKYGKLVDVIFDEWEGSIKAIICSRGFFDDVLDGRRVIMINGKTAFEEGKIIVGDRCADLKNEIYIKRFLKG